MIRATCNKCGGAISIDSETGNRFARDSDMPHRCSGKATFVPGQMSNEQIVEMERRKRESEPGGFCEACKTSFRTFHDAWVHMMEGELGKHQIHSVEPVKRKKT